MPRAHAGPYTVRGITYQSQYAYRKHLAESAGIDRVREYRKTRHIEVELDRLSKSQHKARERALKVLTDMRVHNFTWEQALKTEKTTAKTVKKYAGDALQREGRRIVAKAEDSIPRRMWVPNEFGFGKTKEVILSSKDAHNLGLWWNAVRAWRRGNRSKMDALAGVEITVRGQRRPLPTSDEALRRLEEAGELDIDDIYEELLAA